MRSVSSGKSRSSIAYLTIVLVTGLVHVALLTFLRQAMVASNVLQLFSPLMAASLCLHRARGASSSYLRAAWKQMAAAFFIWAAAQSYFAWSLIVVHATPRFPSPSDFLWLLFAFPILLLTMTRQQSVSGDWVLWLDTAEACIFFVVLFCLAFSRSAALSVSTVYDVQSVALVLACGLRYSQTTNDDARIFFRNLGGYLLGYGLLSAWGNRLEQQGTSLWGGLCWSMPPLLFCALTLLCGSKRKAASPAKARSFDLPQHLHGLSSLGLSVMSIGAAAVLQSRHALIGHLALGLTFTLFAVRTTVRESQLKSMHANVRHVALHDPLTGLANRTHLRSAMKNQLTGQEAASEKVALLFIDLDRFKAINDSFGHPFGDRLLVEVGETLQASVRIGDTVARLGGDEFVILLPCRHAASADELAARLIERFRKPFHLDGRTLYVTLSIGIATGEAGRSEDDLLLEADCAMYIAKRRGKNQSQTFVRAMTDKAAEQFSLGIELRQLLEGAGITPYYQPIYSASKNSIVGFEALARWHHDERGVVSPAQFVPLAEESGLIVELGTQMLRYACRQTNAWNSLFGCAFTISVNVSASQIAEHDFLATVTGILNETGLDPSLLKLEITESVVLSGIDALEETLCAVRQMGVQISLDDFGTGYSSLSYLLQLPFDVVKIDQSFIRNMDQDPQRASIVQSVIQLAKALGKEVVAEGVETEAVGEWLARMQCDLLQGYFFAKPLTALEVRTLVEHRELQHCLSSCVPGSTSGSASGSVPASVQGSMLVERSSQLVIADELYQS